VVTDSQTVSLGDGTFSHVHGAEQGLHTFENGTSVYRFKEWTWGQKNAATSASVVFDQESGGFRIDTTRFNEAMLTASLVEATVDGEPLEASLPALRELKASLGDGILQLAQWVNRPANGAERAEPLFDPETETYRLAVDGGEYVLREWTWGEKNVVADRSVVYDPATDRFRVDTAAFNELMLEATLVQAPFEVTLDELRDLPAPIGDALLEAVQHINGLAETEKKGS
jgi:hypothetical protein